MTEEKYPNIQDVAARAAADAIATLAAAIERSGRASWVLAGGTSPNLAYEIIARDYGDALDWSKVVVLVGDERCVPPDHPDSNWGKISQLLLANRQLAHAQQLVPQAQRGAENGATHYERLVNGVLAGKDGGLHIDLLWLGVGEDGHTLSLFPGHPELSIEDRTVVPVHDSPKPPSDRISLSFSAAVMARKIVIFAVGASKRSALAIARRNPQALPIGRVADAAARAGGEVLWLYDEAAVA